MTLMLSLIFLAFLARDIESQYSPDILSSLNLDVKPAWLALDMADLLDVINQMNVTMPQNKCLTQLQLVSMGFAAQKDWAFRMIDATAKVQSGIFKGNIMHIGNYDECLEVNADYLWENIRGKYCTALFMPHEVYGKDLVKWLSNHLYKEVQLTKIEDSASLTSLKNSFGFCLPASCNSQQLQEIFNKVEIVIKSPLHFHFLENFCTADDPKPLNTAAIFATIVFSGFGIIVFLSTLYDVLYHQKLADDSPNLYVAFSAYSNGKRLLSVKSAEGNLECLNGLRVMSMLWIILCHRFMFSFFLPQTNTFDVFTIVNRLENMTVVGGNMGVDTFFTISGLLVMFIFLRHREKSTTFSLFGFYFHRILRLTPSLAMVLFMTTCLMGYVNNGPLWPAITQIYQKPCEDHWWHVILYIQNFFRADQCLGHTWYLAVDTQLYLLSPLVLFSIIKWPKPTIVGLLLVGTLSCVYTFEITYLKNLGTTFFEQDQDQSYYVYTATHSRMTTYLIGMICGYFIFKTKDKPIVLSKLLVITLWALALSILLAIVLCHYFFVDGTHTSMQKAMFNTFSRPGWSAGLCIIIILCIRGYGGIINSFLSNPVFTVLIRLNYSMYLLHAVIVIVVVGEQRVPFYFSDLMAFHQFWGDFMFTLGASVIWTLTFETPILVLEKLMFERGKGKTKEPPSLNIDVNNKIMNNERFIITKKTNELDGVNVS